VVTGENGHRRSGTVELGESPTFRRNISPQPLESTNKPLKMVCCYYNAHIQKRKQKIVKIINYYYYYVQHMDDMSKSFQGE
jgi:hypothetical protein